MTWIEGLFGREPWQKVCDESAKELDEVLVRLEDIIDRHGLADESALAVGVNLLVARLVRAVESKAASDLEVDTLRWCVRRSTMALEKGA